MSRERIDLELPVDLVDRLARLGREWFPHDDPQTQLDRAFGRMVNLGIRRLQENPAEMEAFLNGELPYEG